MPTSQNGWPASPTLKRRDLIVNGVTFVGGILDNDNVAVVFTHLAEQYAKRVEPLKNPGCWGFSYRPDVNQVSDLSNHASGTAIDINAPEHPNGVPTSRTLSPNQITEVHAILRELGGVVRWGGDYTHTVDAMHFEINVPVGGLQAIGEKLRSAAAPAKKPATPPAKPYVPGPAMKKLKAQARHVRDANKPGGVVATAVQKALNVLNGIGKKK